MATRSIIFQLKTKIKTIIQLVNYLRKKNLDSSAPGQKNLERKRIRQTKGKRIKF